MRKTTLCCCLIMWGAGLGAGSAVAAEAKSLDASPQAIPVQDSIQVQKLRNEMVQAKRRKVYYTGKTFDVEKLPHYVPDAKVSGTLRIWGLNYLGDCMLGQYWQEGFAKYQPGIKVEYRLAVAMLATSALCTGSCDIGANRRITFTETLQFQRIFNYDPLEIPLATGSLDVAGWSDAMCVFVNAANPMRRLTVKQLDGIFGAARLGGWAGTAWHPEFARGAEENLRCWGDVGLEGEWKHRAIQPYGAVVRYDTATKFSDAVLHSSDKWNENVRMYANYQTAEGKFAIWEQLIADDLARDPAGIGYDGYGYKNPAMKPVAIQFHEGSPYVLPTLETIQDRTYELFQANYWYVNREPGKPLDPKIKEFLRYVLSQEGQREVIRDGKYLPLNAALVTAALRSLEEVAAPHRGEQ